MSLNPFDYIDLHAMWQGTLEFFPRFLAGVLVFAAFYILYQATALVLRTALERQKTHASLISLSIKTYKYVLVLVGVVLALTQMGVDVGAALTGLGIAGVALGFAAKDTLSNYIAGVTIFWDKPFHVGDYIEVEGSYGRVTEITMRSTRIRTLQNQYLIVPNQNVISETVINHSKNGEVRVEIPLSISYHDHIVDARAVLLNLVDPEEDKRLSQYLRPTIVVNELGDNGVNLLLRVWINKAEDEWDIYYEYMERAKRALEAHNMTIPFPQTVMHLPDIPEETWHENQRTHH